MTIGELARAAGFYLCDRMRGGAFAKHIKDLQKLSENPQLRNEVTEQRLTQLLEHACSTTNFYRQFAGARQLSQFPVIEKRQVRERYGDFLSNKFTPGELVTTTTSGSYGTPFTFYLTKDKKTRQQAEVSFFSRQAGYKIGTRHAYVVAKKKGRVKLLLQNEVLMNPAIMDEAWLARQRRCLCSRGIRVMIGYPSAILRLAEYCADQGNRPRDFAIKAIFASSEPLYDSVREKISSVLGGLVLSRYSTEEFGVLAQECVGPMKHHLNEASYVIEVLSPTKDEPVTAGQLGRVVVTDLFSHAMPLIRYDTGDLAVLGDGCTCGSSLRVLQRVEGRMIESVWNTAGTRISPFAVNGLMRDIDAVIQFQFIQEAAAKYTLKLVTMPQFSSEAVIRQRLGSLLGADGDFNIQYVDCIPALPSGKRPYILSKYTHSH